MIQIITGDKGKGKTKVLIDKVNNEVKVVQVLLYLSTIITSTYMS